MILLTLLVCIVELIVLNIAILFALLMNGNSLPNDIKESVSISSFKRKVIAFLGNT